MMLHSSVQGFRVFLWRLSAPAPFENVIHGALIGFFSWQPESVASCQLFLITVDMWNQSQPPGWENSVYQPSVHKCPADWVGWCAGGSFIVWSEGVALNIHELLLVADCGRLVSGQTRSRRRSVQSTSESSANSDWRWILCSRSWTPSRLVLLVPVLVFWPKTARWYYCEFVTAWSGVMDLTTLLRRMLLFGPILIDPSIDWISVSFCDRMELLSFAKKYLTWQIDLEIEIGLEGKSFYGAQVLPSFCLGDPFVDCGDSCEDWAFCIEQFHFTGLQISWYRYFCCYLLLKLYFITAISEGDSKKWFFNAPHVTSSWCSMGLKCSKWLSSKCLMDCWADKKQLNFSDWRTVSQPQWGNSSSTLQFKLLLLVSSIQCSLIPHAIYWDCLSAGESANQDQRTWIYLSFWWSLLHVVTDLALVVSIESGCRHLLPPITQRRQRACLTSQGERVLGGGTG